VFAEFFRAATVRERSAEPFFRSLLKQDIVKRMLPFAICLLFAQPAAAAVHNVRDYGAAGNGRTDDTRAVQSAVDAAKKRGGGTVYFPASAGCYVVNRILWYSNVTIRGEHRQVCVKKISTPTRHPVWEDPVFYGVPHMSDSRITTLTIDGNRANQAKAVGDLNDGSQGIALQAPRNVAIDNVTILDCALDGIYITGAGTDRAEAGANIEISNVTVTNSRRNGMSIITGRHIFVRDSVFEKSQGTDPQAGIDIEPNNGRQPVGDITFENCVFRDNRKEGALAWEEFAGQSEFHLAFYNCRWEHNAGAALYVGAKGRTGFILDGVYASGVARDNGPGGPRLSRGGVEVWNASNVVLANLTVADAAQGAIVMGKNGSANLVVANSTLSGSHRDINAAIGNAILYHSVALAHGTAEGAFERLPGTAPKIAAAALPVIARGRPYVQRLSATGDAPIAWTVVRGSLPPGVTLSREGLFSGQPKAQGSYTFTLRASNAIAHDQKTYGLTVNQ
jgi:hypothetical protein